MQAKENLLSAWSVLIGVVLAITLGVFQITFSSNSAWVYIVLSILGIIIGFASVTYDVKNSIAFLLATVSLVIVSSTGLSTITLTESLRRVIGTILNALMTMFIPATIIVAVKTVFSAARIK